MIYPNKFTSLDESVLGKISHLMLEGGTIISVAQLRKDTAKSFTDISEFILALDTLFVLGKINLDHDAGIVSYVD